MPRLRSGKRLSPVPDMAAEYAALSPEVRVFLYFRGMVIVRMLVTVIAVGVGMFVGALPVVILMVALKTAVAVIIEAGAIVDIEKRAAALVRAQARTAVKHT